MKKTARFSSFINTSRSTMGCKIPGKLTKCSDQAHNFLCLMSDTSCCLSSGYSSFFPCKCHKGQIVVTSRSIYRSEKYMYLNDLDQVEIVEVREHLCRPQTLTIK